MSEATIRANLHQSLDVHRHLATQIALYPVLSIYDLAKTAQLALGEIFDTGIRADIRLREDVPTARPADAIDISETDFDTLALR